MATIKTAVIGALTIESQMKRVDGEYIVRVRQQGDRIWYAPADYFTDNRQDALATQVSMMHQFREVLAGCNAR